MSGRGELRKAGGPIGTALGLVAWMLVTLWLGVWACWRGARLASRLPRILSKTLRCPRGHAVPAYGVFICGACRAQFEGHAFASCPACGAVAAYVPCPHCGLSVKDPAR